MARLSCIVLLLGARGAAATTATDTFTATLPTATETFTLPTTAATSTETYTLPTATFTLPTGGATATHTFTLPTSTATYDNKTNAPTMSPTSPTVSPSLNSSAPTSSPSGTQVPTGSPSKVGDTIAPTGSTITPSKQGDTIAPTAPVMPTTSPSKAGDTSTPRAPTVSPSKTGDTLSPTKATVQPTNNPTNYPSLSPSRVGDTISPTTAQPTSSTSDAVVLKNIEDKLVNKEFSVTYGGPGCNTKSAANTDSTSLTITILTVVQTIVAGGSTYVFSLNTLISAALSSDTEVSSRACPSGGFVNGFRNIVTSTIVLSPQERMPLDDIQFTNTSAHRRNQVLSSGVNVFICHTLQGTVCVTAYPTKSPVSPTPRPTGGHDGDDDFPGWAIALCVVLPVLAIGAAVAIYFFVCNKGGDEQGDDSGNAPDADAGPKENEQV